MPFLRRRRTAPAHRPSDWSEAHAKDVFTYEMLTLRELEQDAGMWQTPALALTAQAFLLTIALNDDFEPWARLLAGVLGVVVAAASMQLMARHRQHQEIDRVLLDRIEERLGIEPLAYRRFGYESGVLLQEPLPWKRDRLTPGQSAWRKRSSYAVWQATLAVFLAVNVIALGVAVVTVANGFGRLELG